MINQRFRQGVSNLSTVAELRTFDGIRLLFSNTTWRLYIPVHKGGLNFILEKNFNWTQTANNSYGISKTISLYFLQNLWKCTVCWAYVFKISTKSIWGVKKRRILCWFQIVRYFWFWLLKWLAEYVIYNFADYSQQGYKMISSKFFAPFFIK